MIHSLESLEARRLLAAGDLDPTFGAGGAVALRVGQRDVLQWVGKSPGGKIVAAITVGVGRGPKLHLIRLNPDGSFDQTFGEGGRTIVPAWAQTREYAVAPDGRIAVASDGEQIVIVKPDGTVDESIGPNGQISATVRLRAIDPKWQFVTRPLPEFTTDNKLVLSTQATSYDVDGVREEATVVFRFNPDGQLDPTFSGDGVAISTRAATLGWRMAVTSDGTVLVPAGTLDVVDHEPDPPDFNREIFLLRFDANGNELEPHHLFTGEVLEQPHYTDLRQSTDGSVVGLSARPGDKGVYTMHVERFAAAGGDRTLQAPADIHPDVSAARILAGPDGKPIVVGRFNTDAGGMFIERYTPAGAVDTTFGGGDGVILPDLALPGAHNLSGVVSMDDGDFIVATSRTRQLAGTVYEFVFARFQGDEGTAGATLNSRGTLTVQTSDSDDDVSVSIRNSDGRLIVRRGPIAQSFAPTRVKRINIFTFAGNDRITLGDDVRGAYIESGAGNDTVNGSADTDVVLAGAGDDQVFGNAGNDILLGGDGNDYLLGAAGKDDLFGDAGRDTLSGAGGNDRLFGGGDVDWVYGGAGTDSAANDTKAAL